VCVRGIISLLFDILFKIDSLQIYNQNVKFFEYSLRVTSLKIEKKIPIFQTDGVNIKVRRNSTIEAGN